ncbi:MAG: hypothetical protein IJ300_09775 [Clostridia bacterium]|nr:hypothetical protein [Clostridia bacterium]
MDLQPNAKGKTPRDYLAIAAQKLIGKAQPEGVATKTVTEGTQVIDKKAIEKAAETLKKYKDGKKNFEDRIVEEEQWWKLRHWDVIGKGETGDRPQPTSAWMFNSIASKHADIMDNYPEPNVLPRERGDEKSAKILSSILPVIYERNNYEETYSDAAWYKLKHGVVAKGVFWNTELEEGLGDIDTQFIDMLNIFWEAGITNIQSSRDLFIVSLKDNDLIEKEYPQLKGKNGGKVIDVKQYVYDDTVDVTNKSVVVDWYYKKRNTAGKIVLHFCKFVGNEVLFASENMPEYAEKGFYNHGLYPVEFDVLFPEEGTPIGFGYIAIMKSPQMYIDKLQQVILENAIRATKPRFFAKKNVGINIEEFKDETKEIVFVESDIDEERLRRIDVQQVGGNVLNALQMKIDELKETSSNRDFSQGSTASGVTSGAAISALQEAGNKTSRDMISASYRSYTRECYLAIELMRQFYDETRSFRITGETGKCEFIDFNNKMMQGEPIPPAYVGQELEDGYIELFRKPVYDIVVKPQKRSPYSKMAQNELAKEMYNMGFFNPQLAEQSMTALELMDFDGIEVVKEKVQQGQTLMNMVNQMSQELAMLKSLMGVDTPNGVAMPVPNGQSGGSMGQAQKNAQQATMTSYGERLASRANPDMNND